MLVRITVRSGPWFNYVDADDSTAKTLYDFHSWGEHISDAVREAPRPYHYYLAWQVNVAPSPNISSLTKGDGSACAASAK